MPLRHPLALPNDLPPDVEDARQQAALELLIEDPRSLDRDTGRFALRARSRAVDLLRKAARRPPPWKAARPVPDHAQLIAERESIRGFLDWAAGTLNPTDRRVLAALRATDDRVLAAALADMTPKSFTNAKRRVLERVRSAASTSCVVP